MLWVAAHFVVTPAVSVVVLPRRLLRVLLTRDRRTRLVIAVGTWLEVMRLPDLRFR
ncbi:MAG TPA: hypothetical protein VF406_06990 [Thermodesulfobacteriota bacterium]